MERLQKVIAEAGIASRRKAEELIKQGQVKVNGKVVTELGTKVSDKDEVMVNNRPIVKETKEYYLLNKPRGVVTTTSDDKNRKTVIDYINTDSRIYPVGRLDYDTTGAILLTNDGEFANIITHPKSEINKLKDGVELDGIVVKPSRVKLKKVNQENSTSTVEIIIHEGKNHQVKRMFESVGLLVDKLKRERIGIFNLEGLQSGEYRKLTPKEVAIIYSLKK